MIKNWLHLTNDFGIINLVPETIDANQITRAVKNKTLKKMTST